MANIRKIFSLREGVQVDENTFIVNNSLVGIGTSLPSDFLDVRNSASFSGVITSSNNTFFTGVSTFTNQVNFDNLKIQNNIIEASAGVITFKGDGSNLFNIPTSQWVDVELGIGVSSFYNEGNVGIATTEPRYQLQVGDFAEGSGSPDGFGIRYGDVITTGVITATKFIGQGDLLTDLNANQLVSGIVTQARIPRLELDKIPLIPDSKLEQNLEISGILTALGGFIGSVTGNLEGNVNATTGLSTFNDGEFTGTLTAVASTAQSLTGTPDIRVGLVSATVADLGIAATVTRANVYGDITVGVLTVRDDVFSQNTPFSVGTLFTVKSSGKTGINSDSPNSTLTVSDITDARLEVRSESGSATVNIGGDIGVGQSTGELRYNSNVVEINNYALSDTIIHYAKNNVGDGSFKIRRGDPFSEFFTITSTGEVGISRTNPTNKLEVNGSASIDNNLTVSVDGVIGGDLDVYGGLVYNSTSGVATAFDLDIDGNLEVNGNFVNISGDVNVGGGLTFNSTAGVSTAFRLDVSNNLFVSGLSTFSGDVTAQQLNFNSSSGISTAFDLDVSNNLEVSGRITGTEATFPSITYNASGICTNQDLEVNGTLDVSGISEFQSDVTIYSSLRYNSISGIATAFDLDVSNDFYGQNATFGTLKIPDNTQIFQNSGISTFGFLQVDTLFDLRTSNFNFSTNEGITTMNQLRLLSTFDPLDKDFNVGALSGISTFFELETTSNISIGGTAVFNQLVEIRNDAQIFAISGISTFPDLDVTGNLQVTGVSTFTGVSSFIAAPILPQDLELNILSGLSTLPDIKTLTADIGRDLTLGSESDFGAVGAGLTGRVDAFKPDGSSEKNQLFIGNSTDEVSVGPGAGITLVDFAGQSYFFNTFDIVSSGGRIVFMDDVNILNDENEEFGVIDLSRIDDNFVVPPVVTTTTRDGFTTTTGAIIYNSTTNKHQGYDGTQWNDLY